MLISTMNLNICMEFHSSGTTEITNVNCNKAVNKKRNSQCLNQHCLCKMSECIQQIWRYLSANSDLPLGTMNDWTKLLGYLFLKDVDIF